MLRGFGIWWSSESRYSLGKIEINYVKKLEENLYEISVICEMYYESSHIYWEENGAIPEYARTFKKAIVEITVNDALEVLGFDFRWIK